MTVKRNLIGLLVLLLLVATLVAGAQTDLDYPPLPEHTVPFFTGYSNYVLRGVCVDNATGSGVYNITADPNNPPPPVMTFDVWAIYGVVSDRWPAGRYGWLRPFQVRVYPDRDNFLVVDTLHSVRIARGGLFDYRHTSSVTRVVNCPNFGAVDMAEVIAEFPQTSVVYNPPGATYIPPQSVTGTGQGSRSACTDIVNLAPNQPYRVYELRPDGTQNTIDSGTLSYGATLNLSRFTVTVYVEMGGRTQRYDC